MEACVSWWCWWLLVIPGSLYFDPLGDLGEDFVVSPPVAAVHESFWAAGQNVVQCAQAGATLTAGCILFLAPNLQIAQCGKEIGHRTQQEAQFALVPSPQVVPG